MRPRRRLLLTLAAGLLAAAPAGASASDGTYTQILCFNPDTRVAAGFPPEITNPNSHFAFSTVRGSSDCTGKLGPSSGIVLANAGSGHFADRQFGAIRYDTPESVSVSSAVVWRSLRVPTDGARFVATQHGSQDSGDIYGLPRGESYAWNGSGDNAFVSQGDPSDPLAAANRNLLTIGDNTRWLFTFGCDSAGAGGCDLPAAGALEYRIFAGKIGLADRSNPVPVGAATGELANASQISGPADITFGAVDAGSGIYRVLLIVDDQLLGARVADANGGLCADQNPANTDDYEFTVSQPCKLSGGGTVSFDTTGVPGGPHHLRVYVEDAAGNRASLVDRMVPFEGVAAVRTPNGDDASADVRIVAAKQGSTARVVRVGFGRRVRLAGQLTTATGEPITGAALDVFTRPRFTGAPVRKAPKPVVTDQQGRFSYLAPTGSSRTVRFAYRTNVEDDDYAGSADVDLRVRAGVTLSVSPRVLRNGHTQTYSGRLEGPYSAGRFVDVEVQDGKRWKLVCSVSTRKHGRYACDHRFRRTVRRTRYVFRARVLAQAGLPYDEGASAKHAAIVGP